MSKIINFKSYLKEKETVIKDKWYWEGVEAFNSVDESISDAIVIFAVRCILAEVEAGLMLGEFADEKYIDLETPLFDEIDALYQESAEGCYFCDENVDPNDEEFNQFTQLCLTCQLKVANIVTACGKDPTQMSLICAEPRTIQKTRIK